MAVTKKDVEKTAFLARLAFSDEELSELTSQTEEFLNYAHKLGELDTEGVKPTPHGITGSNAFREDLVEPSLTVEKVMEGAPDHEDGCFKVPKILE